MAVARERLRYDKINVVVTPPGFQAIRSVPVRDNSVVRLEITVTSRQIDGRHRASFKRTGIFYREGGGSTQIQGVTWQSDQTFRSDHNLDIQYALGATDIFVSVRNA